MSKRLNRPSPGLACETTWGPRRHQWSLLWQFPCQVRQDGGEGDRDQDSGRLPVAGLQCENNLFYFAKCLTIFGKEYQGYNMKATNPLSFFMFPSCSKDFELNFDMSTFLRCLPTFSLSTGISLGKCKKSQNFSNTAQSQCVLNSILSQYTDELTPHVEWLEDKKTLANRWKFFVPLIFAI